MQPIAATDFYELTRIEDPHLGPDGLTVVYVKREPDGDEEYRATVHERDLEEGIGRRLTREEGVDSQPRLAPDGDRLAFASTRGADDQTQVWVMPVDGGEAQRLTNVPGGIADLEWGPEGRYLSFTQRSTPGERDADIDLDRSNAETEEYERQSPDPVVVDRLVYRSREEREIEDTTRHVYLLDTDDGSIQRVTTGVEEHRSPTWGATGTLYYAVKRGPAPDDTIEYDVDAYDLETGSADRVLTTHGYPSTLSGHANGRLAFPYLDPERGTLAQPSVRVYDAESDRIEAPAAGIDRSIEGFRWGSAGDELYLLTPDSGTYTIHALPWDGGDARVVADEGHVHGFDVGPERVVVVRSEWDHPGNLFVHDGAEDEGVRLTGVNADLLADREIAEPIELTVEVDGAEIQGWLLRPPDRDADDECPLVVQIHGGPHIMWTNSGTIWHEFQTLAGRGYAVFWCNPRGSAGYGADFLDAIEGDWGSLTMRDVLAGVDAAAGHEGVDETEQFVTGGSFGGYMTGWIVGRTDRFQAAVAQRGVYDLTGFYGTTDQAFKLVEDEWGTTPAAAPDRLWENSPVGLVDAVETPTLVMHAEGDYRVPISVAETYYRLLRKRRDDVRFVRYPRDDHDLSRGGEPAHVVDRIERIARWFDGYSAHRDVPPATERAPDADLSGKREESG